MSIYDDLPGRVSLSGKVRTIEEDLYGVDVDNPSKIRPYELLVPLQDALQNFVPGVYIPVSEKGQVGGVPTLDASGKVPAAQLPISANALPITGGRMEGPLNMDENEINGAMIVETWTLDATQVYASRLDSFDEDIKVLKPLDMENNKITDVAKGSSAKDVATIDNINDHNTSPYSHSDIRNLITAIQGTYVYVGKIGLDTDDVDDTALNNTVFAILSRTPLNGDVLVDNENGEWRFDGTNWVNLGHFDIAMASAFNDGLMSKEDYIKLSNLLNKGDFDNLIATLATMDYLVTNYYNKEMVDAKEDALNDDILLRELLANKATNFSVVDDTKYPTTKAVSERLLNLPIAELNNNTLIEVFEDGNLVVNGYFKYGLEPSKKVNVTGGFLDSILRFQSTEQFGRLEQTINTIIGNKLYYFATVRANSNLVGLSQSGFLDKPHSGSDTYELLSFTRDNSSNQRFPQIIDHRVDNFANIYVKNLGVIDLSVLGISHLTATQMDYWFSVYQALLVSDTNAIFSLIQGLQESKANIAQEAWITPTLINSWTQFGSNTIAYYRNTLGEVRMKGAITGGTTGTIAFVLPIGYRPDNTDLRFAVVSENGYGRFTINTSGNVVVTTMTGAWIDLSNITFRRA